MHPGPMNRGVEIDSAVADGGQSVILPASHLRHRGAHGGDEHVGGGMEHENPHSKRPADRPENKIDRVTDLFIAAGKVAVSAKRRTVFTPIAKSMRAI